ncbi:BREX-1 system adenine-specific DNA-methyltransferase PglX [Flavisolibacter ginsenosidimutans]|uniref:site-specific DNA-methyltransferase (adenine-specific) n=1 Tax=Flavisolibacter ginsenosidimutans TaxID=661481 RepID=A0A5B8UGQ4_9BACT|nr:BREX-1 system adenine-specific DNA-methyltransferase PglX [Flavisolibacter ginsenosidimutans]QEC55280.1 BREX-1 system adenine-specific DNA-methyltransferase PglX [Flavisolibacter ginsenosidimutans]
MNTANLKTFGQKARTLLIDGVSRKLSYWGFHPNGTITHEPQPVAGGYIFREDVFDDEEVPKQWQKLKECFNDEGFTEIAERAAYIWFNRLMAMQILGKNDYDLPLLEPVSLEEQTPKLLKRARAGSYEFLTPAEAGRLKKVLTDYEKERTAFGILLIGYCHSHQVMKRVFGAIDDYTELLLPDDILSAGGFLDLLNNGGYITEEDYKQVELIGWLYQFYISEKKDAVFKKFKDGKKAEAADIPAATQIFTPNWIVKYMVQNTVGKIWLDLRPQSPIKGEMEYLVEAADGNEATESIISEVAELKLLDPAVGSGHILVEGFDLLYKMYVEEYYPAGEAVESILQKNLWGLDIDLRAAQLAQFAVLIKAAQYHPDVLKIDLLPHIYHMPAPVHFTKEDIHLFLGDEGAKYSEPLQKALHLMLSAQNLGSIMQFDWSDECRSFILEKYNAWKGRTDLDILEQSVFTNLKPYLNVLEVITNTYQSVVTNPPYMTSANMNGKLSNYLMQVYPSSKEDILSAFVEVAHDRVIKYGYIGMITLQSWMFIDGFFQFRKWLLENLSIKSLIQFGRGVFGSDFGSAAFILQNNPNKLAQGLYFKLFDFGQTSKVFSVSELRERFLNRIPLSKPQNSFLLIPKFQISAGLPVHVIKMFEELTIATIGRFRRGIGTSDNERFLRRWQEINSSKFNLLSKTNTPKWFAYNKGGEFRRWYGNHEYVINWENNGYEIKNLKNDKGKLLSRPQNIEYNLKENISYTSLTISRVSLRYYPQGFINDQAGNFMCIDSQIDTSFILAFLNSKVALFILENINPTVNILVEDLNKLPLRKSLLQEINVLSISSVEISKQDWNSREISWNFQLNPLVNCQTNLEQSYLQWLQQSSRQFFQLHKNEEELNRTFINIYGLEDELQPDVALEDTTILQEELDYEDLKKLVPPYESQLLPIKKDVVIQQFISYAIGCFMGRYRLDKLGLQIAHPSPNEEELKPYSYTSPSTTEAHTFSIDEDGIIPLMGSKGNFPDDAANKVREFLRMIWGEETLTQNINFIQESLNADLDDYLVKKFWAYHVRTYSKKPIYWLFSSKKGAFQALVYMHRMNRFTAEKLRDKYLIKHIQYLQQEIDRMERNLTALSRTEQRTLDTLRKDLIECNEYDLLLKDVATRQIEFDLDDGVTKNYEMFKGVVAPIK